MESACNSLEIQILMESNIKEEERIGPPSEPTLEVEETSVKSGKITDDVISDSKPFKFGPDEIKWETECAKPKMPLKLKPEADTHQITGNINLEQGMRLSGPREKETDQITCNDSDYVEDVLIEITPKYTLSTHIKPESWLNIDPEFHTGPNQEANTETHLHRQKQPHTDSRLDIEPQVDLHTEPHPDLHTEPHPDLHTEPHPDLHTEPHPDLHTEPHPDLHTEPHPDLHTEPQPDLITEPQPDLHNEPQPDLHTEPQPDLHNEPQPDLHSEPQPDLHTEPEADLYTEPQPDLHTEPQPDLIMEPQPNLHTEPHPDLHNEPQPDLSEPQLPVGFHLKQELYKEEPKQKDSEVHSEQQPHTVPRLIKIKNKNQKPPDIKPVLSETETEAQKEIGFVQQQVVLL